MKKNSSKSVGRTARARKLYDFSGGVRGKYAQALREGYTIRVRATDGTVSEKHVPAHSLVSLEPDVQAYFPDSDAVNHALRKIIELIRDKPKPARPKRRQTRTQQPPGTTRHPGPK